MADFTDEKNLPLTAEESHRATSEVLATPEKEGGEKKLDVEKKEGEHSPLKEAGALMKEMLMLKRRPKQMAIPQMRDEVTLKIEKIMEDGIGDAFGRLSPVAQQEFKLRGEETARTIRELLNSTHVKVKKIFQLILEWLKMLPGINHFFLEQEAKIKTDRILAVKKNKKE